MEDRELIKEILNGDQVAMEKLHRRYVDRIFKYIYMQTNHYHDSEELLQDVFFKAAKQLHKFEGRSSFKTWIFKVARNVVIDYYRKNNNKAKQAVMEKDLIEKLGTEESAELKVLRNSHMDEVFQSLNKLPSHYQMVLYLRFIEGFTLKETAEAMGKTLLAIKALQFRARKELTEHITMEVLTDE